MKSQNKFYHTKRLFSITSSKGIYKGTLPIESHNKTAKLFTA